MWKMFLTFSDAVFIVSLFQIRFMKLVTQSVTSFPVPYLFRSEWILKIKTSVLQDQDQRIRHGYGEVTVYLQPIRSFHVHTPPLFHATPCNVKY